MSRGVDVLAVMDRCQSYVDDAAGFPEQFKPSVVKRDQSDLNEARAVVAELIEAAEAYAEAEAALADRELEGINAESLDRLQPRVHAARRDLESALARVRGAA